MNTAVHLDDEPGFRALTAKIARERRFACGSYKDRCLRRRIGVRMRACHTSSFTAYARHLDQHPAEWDKLLAALTISVTRFFRNHDVFDIVARTVVPTLWSTPAASIRVWSAGCATGEEPYSLAILFHRHAVRCDELDRIGRVRVLASDVDAPALTAARIAKYRDTALSETSPDIRSAYFSRGSSAELSREIRHLVRFEKRDLLSDDPPTGTFNLVMCRNVLIYLDRPAQERLIDRFHTALAPGSFLVLGKTETLMPAQRGLFEAIDVRARVYRRR